jgi:hypothetical protein
VRGVPTYLDELLAPDPNCGCKHTAGGRAANQVEKLVYLQRRNATRATRCCDIRCNASPSCSRPIDLSIYLSNYLSIYLSIYLTIYLSIYLAS